MQPTARSGEGAVHPSSGTRGPSPPPAPDPSLMELPAGQQEQEAHGANQPVQGPEAKKAGSPQIIFSPSTYAYPSVESPRYFLSRCQKPAVKNYISRPSNNIYRNLSLLDAMHNRNWKVGDNLN